MEQPQVKVGDWITIGARYTGPDAYVVRVYDDRRVRVAYYQHKMYVIEEEAIWKGDQWGFTQMGGVHTRDLMLEWLVKRGPKRSF